VLLESSFNARGGMEGGIPPGLVAYVCRFKYCALVMAVNDDTALGCVRQFD
jgi:hypothetical protein